MATLYVAEFSNLAPAGSEFAQIVGTPPLAEQTVTIGSGSLSSNAFASFTRMIRVHADSICSIAFGPSPTATTTNMRLAANTTEYFGVNPGTKIAVISNT